jgi:4a-hydroxytetrahydrobiopterin dehydratase
MHWSENNASLDLDLLFKDFSTAWAFMTEVAMYAEKVNHHPTWTNTYNHVSIKLSTHDAGNTITDKDRKMAAWIGKLLEKYASVSSVMIK